MPIIPIIPIILFIGGVLIMAAAMHRYLNGPTITPYQEICAIKDRLYRDMVRLESLQGHKTASDNVRRILSDVRL